MSTISFQPHGSHETSSDSRESDTLAVTALVGWAGFFFALLQSVCTFFAAVSGLRLVIGLGSLAVGAGAMAAMDRFHESWARLPMIGIALLGSLLNLAILIQIRHLRNRPASQWRQRPVSIRTLKMERVQFVLSIATLVLVAIEEYLHFGFRHTL